jgi:hypothetical protein
MMEEMKPFGDAGDFFDRASPRAYEIGVHIKGELKISHLP